MAQSRANAREFTPSPAYVVRGKRYDTDDDGLEIIDDLCDEYFACLVLSLAVLCMVSAELVY